MIIEEEVRRAYYEDIFQQHIFTNILEKSICHKAIYKPVAHLGNMLITKITLSWMHLHCDTLYYCEAKMYKTRAILTGKNFWVKLRTFKKHPLCNTFLKWWMQIMYGFIWLYQWQNYEICHTNEPVIFRYLLDILNLYWTTSI